MERVEELLSDIDHFIKRRENLHDDYVDGNLRNLEMMIENDRQRRVLLIEERKLMENERNLNDLKRRQYERDLEVMNRRKNLSFKQIDALKEEEQFRQPNNNWNGGGDRRERGSGALTTDYRQPIIQQYQYQRQPSPVRRRPITPPRRIQSPMTNNNNNNNNNNYQQSFIPVPAPNMNTNAIQFPQQHQKQTKKLTKQEKKQRKRVNSREIEKNQPTKKSRLDTQPVRNISYKGDEAKEKDDLSITIKRTITNDDVEDGEKSDQQSIPVLESADHDSDVEVQEMYAHDEDDDSYDHYKGGNCICGACDECTKDAFY